MSISRGLVNSIIVYTWRRILCSLEKIEIDPGHIIELTLKGQNGVCRMHASISACVCVCVRKGVLMYMQEFLTDSLLERDSVVGKERA